MRPIFKTMLVKNRNVQFWIKFCMQSALKVIAAPPIRRGRAPARVCVEIGGKGRLRMRSVTIPFLINRVNNRFRARI